MPLAEFIIKYTLALALVLWLFFLLFLGIIHIGVRLTASLLEKRRRYLAVTRLRSLSTDIREATHARSRSKDY